MDVSGWASRLLYVDACFAGFNESLKTSRIPPNKTLERCIFSGVLLLHLRFCVAPKIEVDEPQGNWFVAIHGYDTGVLDDDTTAIPSKPTFFSDDIRTAEAARQESKKKACQSGRLFARTRHAL